MASGASALLCDSSIGLADQLLGCRWYRIWVFFLAYSVIIATLNPLQQLNCDPFLFALHKGSHDLGNALFVEATGLYAVDVFLIILIHLLLTGFLGNRGIPAISIVDSKGLNGCIG